MEIIINKVILLGRLVKDPIQGKAVKFTVAVNRFRKEDGADFINCVAFGKTGETIAQYMQKGSQIALEGRIQTGSYEKDGQVRYTTDVIVDRFEFVGGRTQAPAEKQDAGIEGFNKALDMLGDDLETVDEGDIPF